MKLTDNWLTEGLIDYEYKKYLLLAYLKEARESFGRVELYPWLAELVFHYQNLLTIRDSKSSIYNAFPKALSLEELERLEVKYKPLLEDDQVMKEIALILEFAIPALQARLDEGSYIYDYVESNCVIEPIGLSTLSSNEGYVFISQPPEAETKVYRYHTTLFGSSKDQWRGVHLHYVLEEKRSLSNTYEAIKLRLIKRFQDIPNPATYLIFSRLNFPYGPTLMPVAKRLLARQIATAA